MSKKKTSQPVDPEIVLAKKAYRWLWLSPLLTIPTFIFLFSITSSSLFAISGSALWHLILLQYTRNKKSDFVRWHGRQAFVLAGIRTAIPTFFYLTDGDYFFDSFWPYILLFAVYLVGNIWRGSQARRGDYWIMRQRGLGGGLPLPTQIELSESDKQHLASSPAPIDTGVYISSLQEQKRILDRLLAELSGGDSTSQLSAIHEL